MHKPTQRRRDGDGISLSKSCLAKVEAIALLTIAHERAGGNKLATRAGIRQETRMGIPARSGIFRNAMPARLARAMGAAA
ncbi:MAG: hypothetical protein LAN62_06200 [Acidobacteriia bacterium]|nr:hypothetical protein [Terriglobia bacterium]